MLNPGGLAEVRSDFTGKYSTGKMASQVTVLRMYDLEVAKGVLRQEPSVRPSESEGAWVDRTEIRQSSLSGEHYMSLPSLIS